MDELIRREEAKAAIRKMFLSLADRVEINSVLNELPSVSTEKTDAYKQGWYDAITTALKETHSVHTEEGHFRVVQEETLIGVGMAYEHVSTEKTGRWIDTGSGQKCSNCHEIQCGYDNHRLYCANCGSRNEVVKE